MGEEDLIIIRHTTTADKDAVLAINRNVYNGWDYLDIHFDKYINDKHRQLFLAEKNGKVISFMVAFMLDNDTKVLYQAARTLEEYQGKGYYHKLKKFAEIELKKCFPNLTKRYFVTCGDKPNFDKEKYAMSRPGDDILYRVTVSFPVLTKAEYKRKLANLDKKIEDICTPIQRAEAAKILSEKRFTGDFFPWNLVMINWFPFHLNFDNLANRARELLDGVMVSSETGGQLDNGISMLNCYYTRDKFCRMELDIYCQDPKIAAAHFANQLKVCIENLKDDETTGSMIEIPDSQSFRADFLKYVKEYLQLDPLDYSTKKPIDFYLTYQIVVKNKF